MPDRPNDAHLEEPLEADLEAHEKLRPFFVGGPRRRRTIVAISSRNPAPSCATWSRFSIETERCGTGT